MHASLIIESRSNEYSKRTNHDGVFMNYHFKISLMILAALLGAPQIGFTAIFVVNIHEDGVDLFPGDGDCSAHISTGTEEDVTGEEIIIDTYCTLRAAVMEANAYAGTDTIIIDSSLNGSSLLLTLSGGNEDAAQTGDLDITESLILSGQGNAIDASGLSDRVFHLIGILDVDLSNLSLENAAPNAYLSDFSGYGGALLNEEAVVNLDRLEFYNNSSPEWGGAVYSHTSSVTNISSCVFESNTASVGGAVVSLGEVTMNDSILIHNRAEMQGGAMNLANHYAPVTISKTVFRNNISGTSGGAVFSQGAYTLELEKVFFENNSSVEGGGMDFEGYGSLRIEQSLFKNNEARGGGGLSIQVADGGGGVIILNTTFSGNNARKTGGGIAIANLDFTASVSLYNVTITDNQAKIGGGIYTAYAQHNQSITLRHTIIADNNSTKGNDCNQHYSVLSSGLSIQSDGYNLIGDILHCEMTTTSTDLAGNSLSSILDPGLLALADNGGFTETHSLQTTSPALDSGDPAGCDDETGTFLTHDQRGIGFGRPSGSYCDIGALELQ